MEETTSLIASSCENAVGSEEQEEDVNGESSSSSSSEDSDEDYDESERNGHGKSSVFSWVSYSLELHKINQGHTYFRM